MKGNLRIFITVLTAALLISVTACGNAGMENRGADNPGENGHAARDPESIGLYPAQVSYVGDTKWGYIDGRGEFALKPVYSEAYDFQGNGLAVAGSGGKTGVINTGGRFVVEPVYSYIENYRDGLAIAQKEDGFRAIDEKGAVIFGPASYIGSFSDGRAVFYRQAGNGKLLYGYIDTSGNIVAEPKYEYAGAFNEGFAVARLAGGGYVLLDFTGREVRTFNYNYLGTYSEGLMAYREKQDGKYGYVDKDGGIAIKPQFTMAQDFKDGAAVVNMSQDPSVNRYGLIDTKGKFIVQPQYNDILSLGEDMLALGIYINKEFSYMGSRYAVAGADGIPLTDFVYYGVSEYRKGIASAFDDRDTFFIDRTGRKAGNLPSVEGSGTLSLFNSIVKADVDRRLYYINREGKIVYRPSDCTKLKIGVTVCEAKYRPNRNYLVYYPELSGIADPEVQKEVNRKLREMSVKTGITPEAELDYSYDGSFDIGFNRKKLLVLELTAYNYPFGAAHGMPFMKYAHINTESGRFYELKDLFKSGSDYVKVLSDIIAKQIKEHGDEMGVWPDSYRGIAADQPFFITEKALNLYFEPYEIAPYAAGFPTFTIPFTEIMDIIRTDGSFWLAFN